MIINKLTLGTTDFPDILNELASPPAQLYHTGAPLADLLKRPRVAVIGSRSMTAYGQRVTMDLAGQLAEQGVVIISGLAIGVDAAAHQAALAAGGLCIGVLPCPLDKIVPTTNRRLAARILGQGGALVSEYAVGLPAYKQNFVARNRLMSGLADGILITEAGLKSGTLHTARFALDQGREVMVVPGNIYWPGSVGIHNLLKASKASVVTEVTDILNILGLNSHTTAARDVRGRNAHEQTVLDLMLQGLSDGNQLLETSSLTTAEFNQVLTMLEIGGKIRPLGANHWGIV